MDTKIEIKEEHILSDDFASQDEREFFPKDFTMKADNGDCHMTVKMEIKSETPFSDLCLQRERDTFLFRNQEKMMKPEIVTCSSNYELNTKIKIEKQAVVSYFGSRNDRGFSQDTAAVKDQKYNSNFEMENRVDVKEEHWWQKVGTSYVCNDVKDEVFIPLNYSRCSGDTSSKSPLTLPENMRKSISLSMRNDSPAYEHSICQESHVTEKNSVEKGIHSEQPNNDKEDEETYSKASYLEHQNVIQGFKRSYSCERCEKIFTCLSTLKKHNLIHEGIKPHKCANCEKRFTTLSDLKKHCLVHEGRKLHNCAICEKGFTQLSDLRRHNLIHEGKKPHKCEICEKRFTRLSHLKLHKLFHEGKKQHKCEICEKSFTLLSGLKRHNLIHDGKKAHKCAICEKRFTQLSHLKLHNLIHEGKKPHKCEICEKRFTQLSHLKFHTLVHEGKRPHKCEICEKRFTRLSHLKSHNLTHKTKSLHNC